MEMTASGVRGNLYVVIASAVSLVVVGLLLVSYLPAYTDRTWGIVSSVVGGVCYAAYIIPLLYAISRLTKLVARRRWGLPIAIVHGGALLFGAAFGALGASLQRLSDRRSWGMGPIGVDREAITDTTYILAGVVSALLIYQVLVAAGLGILALIARLQEPRSAPRPTTVGTVYSQTRPMTAAPRPARSQSPPFAPAPSSEPDEQRSWRLQRDSVAANIGIVTGVAGVGLGFNGNRLNAALSLGLGVIALALVYLVSRRPTR